MASQLSEDSPDAGPQACAHRYRGSRGVDVVDGDDEEGAVDVGVRPELAQLRDVIAVDRERSHLDTPNHLRVPHSCKAWPQTCHIFLY